MDTKGLMFPKPKDQIKKAQDKPKKVKKEFCIDTWSCKDVFSLLLSFPFNLFLLLPLLLLLVVVFKAMCTI